MNAPVELSLLESTRHCSDGIRPIGPIRLIRPIALALLATVLAATRASSAAPLDDYTFTQRNGTAEWAASGDFNGDGLLDAVIVDRVTGAYRIGYQSAGGQHTWTTARASGIADVSGFSVGHLLSAADHGLAFVGEAANRVNMVSATSTTQAGVPVSVFLPSVGPNQVIALDLGGGGNTALQDLIVPTARNGVAPFRTTTVRNTDGASFTTVQDLAAAQRQDRGNRVVVKEGTTPVLAILSRGPTDTLRLVSYAGGPPNTFLQIPNLTAGSDYAIGQFTGTGLRNFLTFRPGDSNLWSHAVLEPMPGTFAVEAPVGFGFDHPIESVVTLPGTAGAKILIIFAQGTFAAAYNFDGTDALAPAGEFPAPEGEVILTATPIGNNGVRLHTGGTGKTLSAALLGKSSDIRTSRSLQYSFNAGTGTFALDHDETLPPVSDLSGRANVLQFRFEPFVHSAPGLLNSANAGDWTSLFSLAGLPPQVGVTRETFGNSAQGLDNPTPANLGTGHPLAQFGLGNQYSDAVSIFRLNSGPGDEVVEVSAQPPGGLYARSVAVSFVLGAPGYAIHYRLNPAGAWLPYVAQPVLIFTNSTLQFRAQKAGDTLQTAIHSEVYTFQDGPNTLDSDGDGVPDYVEIANGLNPRGGSDSDLDGASDLEELLKDTEPNDDTSFPPTAGYEQHATVDWTLTPRPIDGTTGAETAARSGQQIQIFGFSGNLLSAGPVRGLGSAVVSNVFIDPQQPLLLATTEPHFDIVTAGPDWRLGRELVALLPSPQIAPIEVDYAFGAAGGVLNNEALNWVNAAQLAYNSATRETRAQTMPVARTTAALLLEEKLRRVLGESTTDVTNLTLFPFRPNDASRQIFDTDIHDRLRHDSPTRPAYDLRQMHHSLESLVVLAPNRQVQALNDVATEIYRLSSASNNAAPGQYHPPFDVVRDFIRGGGIHPNYLAVGSFPAVQLADATAGVQHVMDNLGSRPVTNLTLRIRPDTLSGSCTLVETVEPAPKPVNLFASGGGAYDFPEAFELLPGTIIHVTGRPDVISTTCAGLNVEVLDISLEAVAVRSGGDENGNLLIDAWENIFLGGGTLDPFGDEDRDGYSNLQEMFEGTDPRDGLGVPTVPAASLQLPVIEIDTAPDGAPRLEWTWPEAYMSRVQFQVISSEQVTFTATVQPIQPIHVGNGLLRATVLNSGETARFFKVSLQLRF